MGHARRVERVGGRLDAARGLRGGLDDDGRPGGERGEHSADGDGDGEVPRRGDEGDRRRGEPGPVGHRPVLELFCTVGVVAREVGGLGDLRVGLGRGLAGLGGHDREERLASPVELAGGLAQDGGALARRPGGPARVRGSGAGDDLVDLVRRAEVGRAQCGWLVGHGPGGPVAVGRQRRVGVGRAGEGLADHGATSLAPRADRGRRDVGDALPEAPLLLGHRGRVALGEEGMEEVLRRRVLLEAAHEVRHRGVEVGGVDDGGVEDHGADRVADRPGLRGRHALEHLDVDRAGDAALLREQVGRGEVVEVVARDADPYAGRHGVGPQGALDAAQIARVDLGLGLVGGLRPVVQLGLDLLHREVGALDEAHLDARTACGLASLRESDEPLQRRERVGQVGLQDDAGLEPVELLLGEHPLEDLERQVEVAVLLHVEVDELVVVLGSEPVERAQPVEAAGDRALGVPRDDLAHERGDLDRDVVDVGTLEQPAGAVGATRRLVLAEDGLAEEVDVEPEALLPRGGEVPAEGGVAGVDEQVPDHLAHPGAGDRDNKPRRDPRRERPGT